jgi:general secretion pathway protein E
MFEVTDAIQALIMDRAHAGLIKEAARKEGMLTLREAAVRKMIDRATSFEQVLEVTRQD